MLFTEAYLKRAMKCTVLMLVDMTVIVNNMHSKQSAIPTSGWSAKRRAAIMLCVELLIYIPSEPCQAAVGFSNSPLTLPIICAIASWLQITAQLEPWLIALIALVLTAASLFALCLARRQRDFVFGTFKRNNELMKSYAPFISTSSETNQGVWMR